MNASSSRGDGGAYLWCPRLPLGLPTTEHDKADAGVEVAVKTWTELSLRPMTSAEETKEYTVTMQVNDYAFGPTVEVEETYSVQPPLTTTAEEAKRLEMFDMLATPEEIAQASTAKAKAKEDAEDAATATATATVVPASATESRLLKRDARTGYVKKIVRCVTGMRSAENNTFDVEFTDDSRGTMSRQQLKVRRKKDGKKRKIVDKSRRME
jgi:hypothetical protein